MEESFLKGFKVGFESGIKACMDLQKKQEKETKTTAEKLSNADYIAISKAKAAQWARDTYGQQSKTKR